MKIRFVDNLTYGTVFRDFKFESPIGCAEKSHILQKCIGVVICEEERESTKKCNRTDSLNKTPIKVDYYENIRTSS